jgi:hypothetical protein
MAGEWVPIDVGLELKPEVQRLVDLTGEPVEIVCWRLVRFWGWASLNSADGTAIATPAVFARIFGGNVEFWAAVAAVGWVRFDPNSGVVEIPGFDRRFSNAAKARALSARRSANYRHGRVTVASRDGVTRGEDINSSSSPSPVAARGKRTRKPTATGAAVDADQWATLRAAWNAGAGAAWRSNNPPDGLADRLAEPGWFVEALRAVERLPALRAFRDPVTLLQIVKPGFVAKILGGQFDSAPRTRAKPALEDRPPPREWDASAAAAARATRERLERQAAAEHQRLDDRAALAERLGVQG